MGKNQRREMEAIINAHQSGLIGHIASITKNLEVAKELTQETFIKLCERPDIWKKTFLKAWLHRVARNLALDYLKKHKREDITPDSFDSLEDSRYSPFQALSGKRDWDLFINIFNGLTEKEQEVLRLKVALSMSYKEIGAIMGLEKSRVGVLLHQTLKKMKQKLVRLEDDWQTKTVERR